MGALAALGGGEIEFHIGPEWSMLFVPGEVPRPVQTAALRRAHRRCGAALAMYDFPPEIADNVVAMQG